MRGIILNIRIKRYSRVFVAAVMVAASCFVGAPVDAAADAVPQYVRVGLEWYCSEKDSIALGNSAIEVRAESTSEGMTDSLARLTTALGGFAFKPDYCYVAEVGAANDYDSAAISAGEGQVPVLTKQGWRVYAVSDVERDGYAAIAGLITLFDGGTRRVIFDGVNPQAAPVGGFLTIGERSYRGVVEFGRYNGKKLSAVNIVGMDEYLYSVVPSEMPSSWGAEALKAQAVASRTYAANKTGGNSSHKGAYVLCDTTHCQVYKGAGNEDPRPSAAVDATSGVIMRYGGKPIDAVFFSSSGGATENSENVWGTEAIPYLRGVAELNEVGAKEWRRSFSLDELTRLASVKWPNNGGVTGVKVTERGETGRVLALSLYFGDGVQTLRKEEIRTFFSPSVGGSLESRNFFIEGGGESVTAKTIASATRTEDALVYVQGASSVDLRELKGISTIDGSNAASAITDSVEVITANGSTILQASVGGSAGSSGGTLLIGKADGAVAGGPVVVFAGTGWGHGIGMSQCGAKGLGELGWDYKAILTFYYAGVDVGR